MTWWRCAVLGAILMAIGALPSGPAAAADGPLAPAAVARIDRIAKAAVHRERVPGLAIGVVADGAVVYARGFGFANLARHVPVTPQTQFPIGHLTEPFTAAAALMLVDAGKLKLDDPIVKYVPELAKVAKGVTVAELLTQTSGLPDLAGAAGIDRDQSRQIALATILRAVDALPPAAPGGTTYAANDLNYIVAGLIVERVTDLTLSDDLEQRVFVPLVMDRTLYAGDTGLTPTHALGYARAGRGFAPVRPIDPSWLLGARGVISCIDDLAKWDIEMPLLLRVDAMRSMFAPAGRLGPTRYGMGWVIDARGGKRFVWSRSTMPGYQAANFVLPKAHVAVIVLANGSAAPGVPSTAERVAARVLDVVAPPVAVHLGNTVLERAKRWLNDIAAKRIDRTQLTPQFSRYLTDALVQRSNFAAMGKLQSIVPISSENEPNGDTLYEFLVVYPHARYHYKFALTADGKVDEILLEP